MYFEYEINCGYLLKRRRFASTLGDHGSWRHIRGRNMLYLPYEEVEAMNVYRALIHGGSKPENKEWKVFVGIWISMILKDCGYKGAVAEEAYCR